ncbi:MAG: crossover junction endodeoxyribonuclease RuvC [Christensenellaceae bacterium]|jgi:crossover junction endodeoxyribonuclease RuvC|nr:crossover junction endodeoxyribonuclease RuvC [Christensenellaceae bacterium]
MIILGIDPGYATLGYGIIESIGNSQSLIKYGTIVTPKDARFPTRLKILADEINIIVDQYKPDAIAVEELFFQSNQKTAILVAEARGVILLVAENSAAQIFEYTPLQVKQVLTGYGHAEKIQIQQMVTVFLKIPTVPKPDDAADALAIALTHARSNSIFGNFKIK